MSQQRRWRWIAPVLASCFLLGSFGILLGAEEFFATLMLPDTFLFYIIYLPILFVGILVSGYILHKETPRSAYQRLPRIMGSICGVMLLCTSGISRSSKFTSVVLQHIATVISRFALGCIYMVGLETLQAWVPDHPGTIAALGALFVPFAIVTGSSLLRYTTIGLDKESACFSIKCVSSLGIFLISQFLERPLLGWSPWTSEYLSAQQRSSVVELENEELRQTEQSDYKSLANQSTFNPRIEEDELLPLDTEMPCFYPFVASIHFSFPFLFLSRLNYTIFAVSQGNSPTTSTQLLYWLLSIGFFGRVLCAYLLETVYKRLRKVYTVMLFLQFGALSIILGSIFVRVPTVFTVALALVQFILSGSTSTIAFMMRYKNKNRKLNFVLSFHCIYSALADILNICSIPMLHSSRPSDAMNFMQISGYMIAIHFLNDDNPVSRNNMKNLIHRIGFRKKNTTTVDTSCRQEPQPC